jgi:2',3'-cyclic-nucleotide 2'-phosphodiesterase (5'-nucleotidase family)
MVAILVAGVSLAAAQELTTVNAERQEVSFGDLAADALCSASNTTICLIPAAAFSEGTIPKNPSQAEVNSLLQNPEETWAVSELTGEQIRRALERSLSRLPLPNTAFLQVSGLVVNFDVSRPRDRRIVSLSGSGEEIAPEKVYEVAMPLFMAQGGSGYFQILDEEDMVRQGSQKLGNLIYDYRQANPDSTYTGQGRIVPVQ